MFNKVDYRIQSNPNLVLFRCLVIAVFFMPMLAISQQANLIPMPPHASSYTPLVRGFWFVAPMDITITGLRVPPEAGPGPQNIQVMKVNVPMPVPFTSQTSQFNSLHYTNNGTNGVIVPVNIQVNNGDLIGILGTAGTTNSYSATTPHTTTIGTHTVSINRFGYQGDIAAGPAPLVWGVGNLEPGQISRVEVYWAPTATHPVDMELIEILSPQTACGLTNTEQVKAVLRSRGTLDLPIGTPLQMRVTLDNMTPISEMFPLPRELKVMDTIHYTFNATLDMSLEKPYNVRVEVVAPGDGEPGNDVKTVDVRNNFTNVYPIRTDFEDWGPKVTTPSCNVLNGEMRGGWMQPSTDDGSWIVGQGSTTSFGTGPDYDFSERNTTGKYLYVETNAPCNVSGNTYLLHSSCIDLSQVSNPGMNFAYHMYGANMGSLHVDVVRFSDGFVFQNVWNKGGNQGNKWHPVVLPLDNFKQEGVIQIQFRAVSGSGNQSVIALDDIRIGELPVLDFGPSTVHDCGFVKLDTKIDNAVYSWSTGEDTRAITIANTGQSTLTMTVGVMVEKNGLYNIDSVNVSIAPGPVVDLGPDRLLLCGQQSYTLDAKNGAMQHTWDNQTTGQFRTVSESGVYWVRVDDGQGCVKGDTIDLILEDIPVAQFTYQNVTGFSFIQFSSAGSSNGNYMWDFGDGNFSDLKDPKYYFVTGGSYTVILIVENECGTDTFSQTIDVFNTDIDVPASLAVLVVAPNPSTGLFNIAMEVINPGDWSLTVTDLQGRTIHQEALGHVATNANRTIDLTGTPKGIYLLQLNGPDGVASRQLVVQ